VALKLYHFLQKTGIFGPTASSLFFIGAKNKMSGGKLPAPLVNRKRSDKQEHCPVKHTVTPIEQADYNNDK